jgi:outer membrane translocation and assembly module TamA
LDLDYSDFIYDTRDFEPDPTSGYYFEIANEYSGKYIGSQFEFNCFYKEKGFGSCLSVRTVVASRLGVGNIFGSNAFFEFQDQWSPDGSINSLGGKQSLRG